jgi:hypothetical protein
VIGVRGVPAARMTLFGENYDPAQPITDPTQYPLLELGPEFGTSWDVVEFIDLNGNNQLDPDDQLRLDDGADAVSLWTAETLKAGLILEPDDPSPPAEWVYIEYEGTWTGNPVGSYREIYPQYGGLYVVLEWIDNGNGVVDLCDWFNVEVPGGGAMFRHAAGLGTDIGVREASGPNPCPEDINGDNVVDVLDLLALLAAWGAAGGPADINGDGIVDVLDLLAVLAAWGPCP